MELALLQQCPSNYALFFIVAVLVMLAVQVSRAVNGSFPRYQGNFPPALALKGEGRIPGLGLETMGRGL